MTRRVWFALIPAFITSLSSAQPKLGDEEWMRHFRDFVKNFDAFVESLNDGVFDAAKWRRLSTDWKKVDMS